MTDTLLKDLFKSLDTMVLERLTGDSLRKISDTPDWFVTLFPDLPPDDTPFNLGCRLPFLDNFLIDADIFWQQQKPGRLKSGVWIETAPSSEEYALEATAIAINNTSILLIEFCYSDYGEKQFLIQKGREHDLNYHSLEKLKEDLRIARDYAQNIIDSSLDMIITVDNEHRIKEFNKAAERAFGYGKEDVLGKKETLLYASPGDEEWLRMKARTNNGFVGDINKKRKNGTMFPVLMSVANMKDGQGLLVGTVRVCRDITAHKQRERELKKAKEEAVSANQAKSDFLANMSHEIRTPMNAILGFTEVLQGLTSDQKQQDYLLIIKNSSLSLLNLINDILDLSKVESGKLTLDPAPLNLHDVFTEIKQLFEGSILKKGLAFIFQPPEEKTETLLLDKDKLKQILINLTGNAIKFTEQGSITLSYSTTLSPSNPHQRDLLITVKDTGTGVADSQQEKIFQAFEQQSGQDHDKFGGTGLGLTITKRLVEAMNGSIVLDSSIGSGSTFHVQIGNIDIVHIPEHNPLPEVLNYDAVVFHNKPTLLSVDDLDLNRQLIKDYLMKYDLNIIEAENGREAIDMARLHKPDLILMDLKMPVMGGFEALNIIRQDPDLTDIPVVIITASGMKETENKISAQGYSFLNKPFKKNELVQVLMNTTPYSIRQITEPEVTITPVLEPPLPVEIIQLVHLKETLEQTFLPKWNNFHDKFYFDTIEKWARDLQILAGKHQYAPLEDWSRALLKQIEHFSIELLPDTLEAFPGLIQKLKKTIEIHKINSK